MFDIDSFFVTYKSLVIMAGGKSKGLSTHQISFDKKKLICGKITDGLSTSFFYQTSFDKKTYCGRIFYCYVYVFYRSYSTNQADIEYHVLNQKQKSLFRIIVGIKKIIFDILVFRRMQITGNNCRGEIRGVVNVCGRTFYFYMYFFYRSYSTNPSDTEYQVFNQKKK